MYDRLTEQASRDAERRLFLEPEFPPETVRAALVAGLRSQKAITREVCAARVVTIQADNEIVAAMLMALNDPDSWVRTEAQSYFLFKTHTFPVPMREQVISTLEQVSASNSENEKESINRSLDHIKARCGIQ
ncbi:MAG: hypothetical protein WD696_20410 [Bryobacteraceae bacterium]